jgi:putative membrane protein
VLGSHTLLAMAVAPLVLLTLALALRGRFPVHRKVARWTVPIWIYVSVTGVAVYVLLYVVAGA